MKNDSIFEKVKQRARITEVVEHFGNLKLNREHKACCPFHSEKTPSFSVKENEGIWRCFGCNTGGDAIDFVAKIRGIDGIDAAKEIAVFYGVASEQSPSKVNVTQQKRSCPEIIKQTPKMITKEQRERNSNYIKRCIQDVGKTDYFKNRGITDETIVRFFLGYDAELDGVVIPYSSILEYQTTRLLSPTNPKRAYLKPPTKEWGSCPIYNELAIEKGGVVFVVESQLCAISIMQEGGSAVALGGLGYIALLLRQIETRDPEDKCIFVLALDNDESGREAQKKLENDLKKMGARYIKYNVAGDCKDLNELLVKSPEELRANIKAAICEANKVKISPKKIDKESQVKALFAQPLDNAIDVFNKEYIDALAYAKEDMPSDYAIFKTTLKGKVNLNDLESAIKHAITKSKKTMEEQLLDLEGIDLNGAISPGGWTITLEEGVRKIVSTRDSEREIIACPDAVIITKRLVNFDDERERFEIAFYKDNRWRTLIASRTQIYNKSTIISFGDTGLHVTSNTANDLVGYLSDYETMNKRNIPLITSIARIGWLTKTQFFPFATDSEVIFEDDSPSFNIYSNLREQGDYGKWKEMIRELRKNPFSRFITSASFAAPLLEQVGVRSFVIHIWNNSTAGKSAALKAAISAWGYFQGIMCNANATKNGIEYFTAALKHLPLGIDEKQAADEQKLSFESLVYMLGENQGKTRGSKNGGTQKTVSWHTLAIITGEEPITSQFTRDGMQTRVLELKGKPVDDEEFAKEVHRITEHHYGFAGAEFLRAVCAMLKANNNYLVERFEDIKLKYKNKGINSKQEDYIFVVTLGDILVETLILGTDAETAEKEAIQNGLLILKNNDEQKHDDNIESAYESVRNWIIENNACFEAGALRCYGKKQDAVDGKGTEYYVLTQPLNDYLTKSGYNVTKVITGFAERGLIPWEKDSRGKKRFSKTTWISNAAVRAYKIALPKALPKEQSAQQQTLEDLIPIKDDGNLPF